MYNVQCSMYNVQCTMCNVQCSMCNVQLNCNSASFGHFAWVRSYCINCFIMKNINNLQSFLIYFCQEWKSAPKKTAVQSIIIVQQSFYYSPICLPIIKSFARLFKGGGVEGCGCPVDTSAEGARRKCPWGTEAPTEPGGETGAPIRLSWWHCLLYYELKLFSCSLTCSEKW